MLIIDMPMPKNCKECPMKEWGGACAVTKQFEPCDGRPSWCPIKYELVQRGECKHLTEVTDYNGLRQRINDRIENYGWFCADCERKDGAECGSD